MSKCEQDFCLLVGRRLNFIQKGHKKITRNYLFELLEQHVISYLKGLDVLDIYRPKKSIYVEK